MGTNAIYSCLFGKKIMKSQNFSLHLNMITLFISNFMSKI